MRTVRVILIGLAVFLGSLFGVAAPALAGTIVVHPGQSIQAAVNSAQAGDTIVVEAGVYHETVTLREDDLTLQGAGASDAGTILEPPAEAQSDVCTQFFHVTSGICLLGLLPGETPPAFEPGGPVIRNTAIDGFLIRDFRGAGIATFHSRFTQITNVAADDNEEYGIASFESQGTRIIHSRATGSDEAGFYIGDSRNSAAGISHSSATGNGYGVMFRDSSQGLVEGSVFRFNCIGIIALDTGAPIDPSRFTIRNNIASHNDRACAPNEDAPPLSGVGILIAGADDGAVTGNQVNNNRASGPSAYRGGIVVVNTKAFGGSIARANTISGNTAFGNEPADLVADGTGQHNVYSHNDCGVSKPGGRC